MDLVIIRVLFIVVLTAACFFLRPFGLQPWAAAVLGAVAAAAVIVFELRVRALSIKRLLGAVLGSVLGIAGAALFGMVLSGSLPPGGTRALLQLFVLMLMSYIGLMVGASKGDLLNFTGGLAELFAGERATAGKRNLKILDTSAIIDGRIADVVETGFLEGTLVVPEFVLRELQIVADSSDSSRRQRGRRGLDILQKMQAHPLLAVQIVEDDFPQLREVDLKLIELAKKMGCSHPDQRFQPQQSGPTAPRAGAQSQRSRQLIEATGVARRKNEHRGAERRQGIQPGSRLPG